MSKHTHHDLCCHVCEHQTSGDLDVCNLVNSGRYDLLEICAPHDSTLTQTCLELGGRADRLGLHNGHDLSKSTGFQGATQKIRTLRPRHLWISCPCGPWSTMQNLNMRTPEQVQKLKWKRKRSAKLIKNVVSLAELQLSLGGEIHWEHPLNALSWNLACVRKLTKQLHYTRLDGCMVGARAADTGELTLKPWGILSSDILMHAALGIKCTHDFRHQPLLGGASCAQSAFYPKTMCRRICKVVLEHPIWKLRTACEQTT